MKFTLDAVAHYADLASDMVTSFIDCELHCPNGRFISAYDVEL